MITVDKLKELLDRASNEGLTDDCKISINTYDQIIILHRDHEWIALAQIDLDEGTITKC